MRTKVKLLLARRAGVTDQMLDGHLHQEAARMKTAFGGRLHFGWAYAIPDPDLYRTAAGAFAAARRPFDALMEIVLDRPLALDSIQLDLNGIGERLSDLIDPTASGILAGTEHIITPGDGPLLVMIANRRLPKFTHAGFLDYWLRNHGNFAQTNTPPEVALRYRQYHADAALSRALSEITGLKIHDFDGSSECYFEDAAHVRRLMGLTDVVDRATEDEEKFVDHDRCVTSVLAITADSTSHLTQ